jgi:hypothetical protein
MAPSPLERAGGEAHESNRPHKKGEGRNPF